MTKEELTNLGLSTELADKILERFKTETLGLVPKEKLEVSEQAKNALEKQVKEYAKNIETLKNRLAIQTLLMKKLTSYKSKIKKLQLTMRKILKICK